jgi:hypothetical protein
VRNRHGVTASAASLMWFRGAGEWKVARLPTHVGARVRLILTCMQEADRAAHAQQERQRRVQLPPKQQEAAHGQRRLMERELRRLQREERRARGVLWAFKDPDVEGTNQRLPDLGRSDIGPSDMECTECEALSGAHCV